MQVELVPTAGVASAGAHAAAVSDGAGAFSLSVGATGAGDVIADLVVTPPAPYTAFRVPSVRIRATDRRGEATVLPRLLADPYLLFVAQLRNRRTAGPLVAASVTLVPRSGNALGSIPPVATSDDQGRFEIIAPLQHVEDVVADLMVSAPGASTISRISNVRISPTYFDVPPGIAAVFPVGASLDYLGELVFRGTRRNVTNTLVTFRRTGGIAVNPPSQTAPVDATGRFSLSLEPEGDGEVVGELTFVPTPGASLVTIPNVRLATYDSAQIRLARFSFGEQIAYALEAFHRGTRAPEPNVDFEFRRTGGVPADPEVVTGRSDATGRFIIAPNTTASGDLIGDLTLRLAGDTARVYHNVRLATAATDVVQFGGVWGVGEQLLYVGELYDLTARRTAPGVSVMFRRTGGIALLSDTLTSVSDASGRFSLFLRTHERGEVTGELVVSSPNAAPSIVPNVRLDTYPTDEVRFAGVYGFGPSLLYVLEVLRADDQSPVPGAQVTFTRTGGIATTPGQAAGVTDALGRIPLGMVPGAAGDVVGTVTVHPPTPWRDTTFVFTGVRISTFQTGELRVLPAFRIPPPP